MDPDGPEGFDPRLPAVLPGKEAQMHNPAGNERGLIGAIAVAALCVLLIFWVLADVAVKSKTYQPNFMPAHMERTVANS